MRNLNHHIRKFFHFSNTEAHALWSMVVLMVLFMMLPNLYKLYAPASSLYDQKADIALLEKNLISLKNHANKVQWVAINSATAGVLEDIEGISPKLAHRIIHYRDKLGGFISLDQYREVYGMRPHLEARLRTQTTIGEKYKPKQLSLNTATFRELVTHPYISPIMAKAIIQYRKKTGPFTTRAVLKTLDGYNPLLYDKVLPYLSL